MCRKRERGGEREREEKKKRGECLFLWRLESRAHGGVKPETEEFPLAASFAEITQESGSRRGRTRARRGREKGKETGGQRETQQKLTKPPPSPDLLQES